MPSVCRTGATLTILTHSIRKATTLGSQQILLLIAGVFILINFISLSLLRPDDLSSHISILTVWVICVLSGQFLLDRYLPNRDKLLFPIVIFLSGWGLVMITRLEPPFADKQSVWLLVSVVAMLIVAILPQPLRWLRNYRYLWFFGGLTLLLSTIVLGSNPSGQAGTPQLWLGFGSIYFQPSEALKIILVAFLASYLAEQYPALRAEGLVSGNRLLALSPRVVGPVILMWSISVVVLVWQRDLGAAMLFFAVFLILVYAAGGYTMIIVGGALLIVIAAIIAYAGFAVVRLRIDIWINPWPESDGRAFQLVQSLQAFASGGIFGQGIGQGAPNYIPVVHSDFVFAAIAEEYGLLGIISILTAIAAFTVRGLQIAARQQDHPFYAFLAIGLCSLIAIQSILIMGGTIRLLPLTGVTLPFLSYGGSSLLTSFIIVGLLLRLSSLEA